MLEASTKEVTLADGIRAGVGAVRRRYQDGGGGHGLGDISESDMFVFKHDLMD